MLKLFPVLLETQTDTKLHISEYCRQYGGERPQTKGNDTNRIIVPKQAVLPSSVFTDNYCVFYN
jgi:hypothetical protein